MLFRKVSSVVLVLSQLSNCVSGKLSHMLPWMFVALFYFVWSAIFAYAARGLQYRDSLQNDGANYVQCLLVDKPTSQVRCNFVAWSSSPTSLFRSYPTD